MRAGRCGAVFVVPAVLVVTVEGGTTAIPGTTIVERYADASSAGVRSTGARHFGHFAVRLWVTPSGSFSRLPHARHTRRTAMTGFLRTGSSRDSSSERQQPVL